MKAAFICTWLIEELMWRQSNDANAASIIQQATAFSSGFVMMLGCILHDCKLDLVTVQGNVNGPRHAGNCCHPSLWQPRFDLDTSVYGRPHAVMDFLLRNAITNIPWLTRSLDLHPTGNLWDSLSETTSSPNFSTILTSSAPEMVSDLILPPGHEKTLGPGHEKTHWSGRLYQCQILLQNDAHILGILRHISQNKS